MGERAVFLDRDGVLNAVVMRAGRPASPRTPAELAIEPDAPAALSRMGQAGYRLFAVTNQPDVARGLMPAQALDAIHERLRQALPALEAVRACTHDDADACACRKPRPGLVLGLAREHGLALDGGSWMVGDQDRDIACGRAAGVATILLRRPYNSGAGADHVVSTLSEAAELIAAAGSAR